MSRDCTLPAEYLKALLSFRYTLDQVAKTPSEHLKHGYPASPPLRSTVVREPQTPGSNIIEVQIKHGPSRMMWLMSRLWDDKQLFLLGLPGLMDEMEYLIQSDQKEKAGISSWVASVFSDLGLIARVHHELDIYQPWAAGFDHVFAKEKETIQREFAERVGAIAELVNNLKGFDYSEFGAPIGSRFKFPIDKRRTKEHTVIMRQAESNLDLFWEKADRYFRHNSGKTIDQAVQHFYTTARPLERTPEWVEPSPAKKSESQTHPELDLQGSFSSVGLGQAESSPKFVAPQPKVKPKTRGTTEESSSAPVEALQSSPLPEDSQPAFSLKNRAFKVFKVLFFDPSQANLPGEISWADFLYAMASTGFAPEKLYGSVWQFTPPSSSDVARGIQFHEPHPVGKIPFRNARRIGRRLSRAYGWHMGMFILE